MENLSKRNLELRDQLKKAEKENNEKEVLRIEDEIRKEEIKTKETEKDKRNRKPHHEELSVAEIREKIKEAEKNKDEKEVLKWETEIRKAERKEKLIALKTEERNIIEKLRQAEKNKDEKEYLILEKELRRAEGAQESIKQEEEQGDKKGTPGPEKEIEQSKEEQKDNLSENSQDQGYKAGDSIEWEISDNKKQTETEEKKRTLRDKIFGLFKKDWGDNEEIVDETYREKVRQEEMQREHHQQTVRETEQELKENVKRILEKGGPNAQEMARELVLQHAEFMSSLDIQNRPIPERMRKGLAKGLEKWDEWGKEGGLKGAGKNILKMMPKLAMIGAVSMVSVDALAQHGVNAAAAIGGKASSYFLRKLGMGIGMGTIMEACNATADKAQVSPEKKEKIKKIISYSMSGIFAAVALASGAWVGAATVAGSVAFGYGVSKITKKALEKKSRNRLEKFSENNIDLNKLDSDIAKLEIEATELIRKNENSRIWRTVISSATGIASSVGMLEVSGAIHAHQAEHTHHQAEMQHAKEHHQQAERYIHDRKVEHDNFVADQKHDTEARQAEHQKLETSVIGKGEGYEHSFIKQIENDTNLAKELGYTGDPNNAKALHSFAEHEAHIIALKTGIANNAGDNLWVKEGNTIAPEIKAENGHVIIEEHSATDGHLTNVHKEGDKFGEHYEKSDTYIHKHETPHVQEAIVDKEHTEPSATEQGEKGVIDLQGDRTPREEDQPYDEKDVHINQPNDEKTNPADHRLAPAELSPSETDRVLEKHQEVVGKLFQSERELQDWQNIMGNTETTTANTIMSMERVAPEYQGLFNYLHKLKEITGLEPIKGTATAPAETIDDYMLRMMAQAENMHKLDDITLNANDLQVSQEHVSSTAQDASAVVENPTSASKEEAMVEAHNNETRSTEGYRGYSGLLRNEGETVNHAVERLLVSSPQLAETMGWDHVSNIHSYAAYVSHSPDLLLAHPDFSSLLSPRDIIELFKGDTGAWSTEHISGEAQKVLLDKYFGNYDVASNEFVHGVNTDMWQNAQNWSAEDLLKEDSHVPEGYQEYVSAIKDLVKDTTLSPISGRETIEEFFKRLVVYKLTH